MARRSKFGRFQVWNKAPDSRKHTDEAYNWDQLDQSLGGPNQSPSYGVGDDFNNPTTTSPTGVTQWLHPQDTTQITNFGNRTLYNIIRALDHNDVPLGAVFAWWRPSTDVPLPSGCVPADGSTYTGATQHSYVPYGLTSITVPDMRNKMILGAYETATNAPTVAIGRDGLAATLPSVDTATAGPGIGAIGGTNVPRALSHQHGVGTYIGSDHTHDISGHYHGMQHNHILGSGSLSTGPPDTGGNHLWFVAQGAGSSAAWVDKGLSRAGGEHTHSIGSIGYVNGYGGGDSAIAVAGNTATNIAINGGGAPASTGTATAIAIGGSSGFALSSTEVLTRYVGLMWMVKIRKDGPLHNTVFSPGP